MPSGSDSVPCWLRSLAQRRKPRVPHLSGALARCLKRGGRQFARSENRCCPQSRPGGGTPHSALASVEPRHVPPTHEAALAHQPVRRPIVRLLRGMHPRLHRTTMGRGQPTRPRLTPPPFDRAQQPYTRAVLRCHPPHLTANALCGDKAHPLSVGRSTQDEQHIPRWPQIGPVRGPFGRGYDANRRSRRVVHAPIPLCGSGILDRLLHTPQCYGWPLHYYSPRN